MVDEVGAENDCGCDNKTENESAEPDVDECVQTAKCVGECTTYCTVSTATTTVCVEPVTDINNKLGLSRDTDECVRTMWCKGNCDGHCKVVEHGKSELSYNCNLC